MSRDGGGGGALGSDSWMCFLEVFSGGALRRVFYKGCLDRGAWKARACLERMNAFACASLTLPLGHFPPSVNDFKKDYVLGFIICEIFTVITLQVWVGWGIIRFSVIPGYPRRANGDSQRLEARPALQDWLRFELFTVLNYRTGLFSK